MYIGTRVITNAKLNKARVELKLLIVLGLMKLHIFFTDFYSVCLPILEKLFIEF
jgi:hypothetical protein